MTRFCQPDPDLCPGCDTELPDSQYCTACECFGWEHTIITLEQAREWYSLAPVERDVDPKSGWQRAAA
jgi:hypothetical protein